MKFKIFGLCASLTMALCSTAHADELDKMMDQAFKQKRASLELRCEVEKEALTREFYDEQFAEFMDEYRDLDDSREELNNIAQNALKSKPLKKSIDLLAKLSEREDTADYEKAALLQKELLEKAEKEIQKSINAKSDDEEDVKFLFYPRSTYKKWGSDETYIQHARALICKDVGENSLEIESEVVKSRSGEDLEIRVNYVALCIAIDLENGNKATFRSSQSDIRYIENGYRHPDVAASLLEGHKEMSYYRSGEMMPDSLPSLDSYLDHLTSRECNQLAADKQREHEKLIYDLNQSIDKTKKLVDAAVKIQQVRDHVYKGTPLPKETDESEAVK